MADQIKADDVLKTFEILDKLEALGVKIVDWDSRDIEIQYPNGERERMTGHYAAQTIARMLNK